MALQLVSPEDKYMLKTGVINHEDVIGHLRQVLNAFAAKPEYSKFYIGITSDLYTRLAKHRATKPDFKLMAPIYLEAHNLVGNAFDRLERKAIETFRTGITHPNPANGCWHAATARAGRCRRTGSIFWWVESRGRRAGNASLRASLPISGGAVEGVVAQRCTRAPAD